jgi:hypothetical protein
MKFFECTKTTTVNGRIHAVGQKVSISDENAKKLKGHPCLREIAGPEKAEATASPRAKRAASKKSII